jgi:hypothetical protein
MSCPNGASLYACDVCDAYDAFADEVMQKRRQQKIMQWLKEEIFFS